MPGSLSRVTGCRWRHAGCKGGFAAPDDAATDGLVSAPLHSAGFAAGRGRSARLGARETNARRRRTRLREPGADKWTKEKSKSCAKRSAARPCWKKTAGRSTSRKAPDARSSIAVTAISSSSSTKAAVGSIPCRPAKGDVFSLAEHLGAGGFVEACGRVADVVGFVPSASAWQRPARPKAALASIAERWGHRFKPRPGSPAWRYLTRERGLPADIVKQAVACDRLREGPKAACGQRIAIPLERSRGGRNVDRNGAASPRTAPKELFRFGPAGSERICITEAAIDAMSLAAIEGLRPDTLYVSTGGGWSPATDEAIRDLAKRANAWLVAATDNNRQGDVYADRVRAIAAEASARYARLRPRADDWNEDLKARRPALDAAASATPG